MAGGLVTLLVVLGAVWWTGHRATLRVVAVTGVPHCDGTEPTSLADRMTGFERVAIPLRRDFTCTLTIRVLNQGDRDVHLGDVTVPVSGPRAGSSFEVTHIGGIAVRAGDAPAAVAPVDLKLDPGNEHLVDLRVVFRADGCASDKSSFTVQPEIALGSLLAAHGLTVSDLPVFVGTPDSSCDA